MMESRRPCILVVDDVVQVRRMYARSLALSGMDVVLAGDGVAGLEQARQHKPDVVVTYLRMPNMDGLQFCRALRSEPATSTVPILMVSSEGHHLAQQATDAGCNALLSKPCPPAVLVATIRQLLGRP